MASRPKRAPRKPSRTSRRASKANDAHALGAHAHLATDRVVNAYLHYGPRNEFNDLPTHTVHLRREHGRWSLAKGADSLRMVHQNVSEREAKSVVDAVHALLAGRSITVSPRLALTWATVRGVSRGIQFASLDALSAFADEAIIANKLNRHPGAKGNRSFFLRVGSRVRASGHGTGVIVPTDSPDAWAGSFVFGGRKPSQAEVRRVLAANPPTRLGIDGKSPVRWPSGRVTWIDDTTLTKANGAAVAADVEAPTDVDANTLARVALAVARALHTAAMERRGTLPTNERQMRSYSAAMDALNMAGFALERAGETLDAPTYSAVQVLNHWEHETYEAARHAAENPWPGPARAAASAAYNAVQTVLYSRRSKTPGDRAWWSTWGSLVDTVQSVATSVRGINVPEIVRGVSASPALLAALSARVQFSGHKANTLVVGREGPYDIAPETLSVDAPFFRRVTLSTADSWAAPHVRGRVGNSLREFERVSTTAAMQETLRSRAKSIGQRKRGRVYVQEPGATRGGDRWALVRKV